MRIVSEIPPNVSGRIFLTLQWRLNVSLILRSQDLLNLIFSFQCNSSVLAQGVNCNISNLIFSIICYLTQYISTIFRMFSCALSNKISLNQQIAIIFIFHQICKFDMASGFMSTNSLFGQKVLLDERDRTVLFSAFIIFSEQVMNTADTIFFFCVSSFFKFIIYCCLNSVMMNSNFIKINNA